VRPARPSYFAFIQSFYGVTMGMLKYKVARQGQIIGEYDASSIQLLINSGNLMVTDHGWATGMVGWKQLRELGYDFPVASPPELPRSTPASFVQPQSAGAPPPLPAELTTNDWRSMPEGPMPAACPKCASPEIRSFGILFQQGAHTSTSVGMTLSGQIGGMVTSGQTHLAAATQPPERGSDGAFLIVTIGLGIGVAVATGMGFGFFGWLFCILIFAGGIYLAVQSSNSMDLEHAKQVYRWKSSWCCMKCGYRFMSMHAKAGRG
jgi:hypothetical protein